MSKPTTVLSVNGFEVTATFAENHNAAAVHHVKQILISSFAGKLLNFNLGTSLRSLMSRGIMIMVEDTMYLENFIFPAY